METRTVMTALAATLAIGVLGTAAAGAETDEELDRAIAECEAAGGVLEVDENAYGEPVYYCLGGSDDVACFEPDVQVGDDRWMCIYFDRDYVVVAKPVTTTGGYGGTGTVSEPTTRPQLTATTTPILGLG